MDNIKLDFQAKLLILAFIISPFTLLRVGFLGLGEVILLVIFLFNVSKKITKKDWKFFYVTKFWLLYLFISIFGLGYNVLILGHETGTIDGMLFDFAAYTALLFSSFILEYNIIARRVNTYVFLKYVFLSFSIVLASLYITSFFTPTIFGLPLKYYDYFAPLVKNLHQVSMLIPPLAFIGIKIFRQERGGLLKGFILALIILDIVMALSTGSTKAMLGIIVGSGVFVAMLLLVKFGRTMKYLILLFTSILAIVILIQMNFGEFLVKGFEDADPAGARSYFYAHALEIGSNSFLVGHGTGAHIDHAGKFWDAHQTYLTVFLQTGILGLVLFVWLSLYTVHNVVIHPSLLAATMAILIYALGGDILRRLPIWFILIFLFHYSVQDELKYKKNLSYSKE
jgi:O-antigen ligase